MIVVMLEVFDDSPPAATIQESPHERGEPCYQLQLVLDDAGTVAIQAESLDGLDELWQTIRDAVAAYRASR